MAHAGQERGWLYRLETAPYLWLAAEDVGVKMGRLDDRLIWEYLTRPSQTGAKYMSEYASDDCFVRGVAANRYLMALEHYMMSQKKPRIIGYNEIVMKEEIRKELYDEIDRILPSVKYCLAPRAMPSGSEASTMLPVPSTLKDRVELDRHAKILYDWLDNTRPSCVRMMLEYQSAGGIPYVAHCHLRCTQSFRNHGASKHCTDRREVTLVEWQAAIRTRHALGNSGITMAGHGMEWQGVGTLHPHVLAWLKES